MALFTESELLSAKNNYRDYFEKSASTIILEERSLPITQSFDIFLSHSYLDKNVILGLNAELEKMGYSVYVDWIADDELDRRKVTKETADIIRKRMKNSNCLFFATSVNSQSSKWMPWECGYFDGLKGKVAVLPVAKTNQSYYNGQEYLGLYPYIDKLKQQNGTKEVLWINESQNVYTLFDNWLKGEKPHKHNS
jgi:hypothetical protein